MKTTFKGKIFGAFLAIGLMLGATGGANANVVALVIDGSGSICPHPNGGTVANPLCTSSNPPLDDFGTQVAGYVNALNSLLPIDGSNAVGVWQFSNVVKQEIGITLIDSQAAKDSVIAALNAMVQLGGSTAIGSAVNVASADIQAFSGAGDWIIDVSTDGLTNTGDDLPTAVTDANNAGIAVNCLGVGPSADCNWNAGGTDYAAATFADFETVVTAKLTQELNQVPEPMTLAIFGFGLAGLGVMRRRRKLT